MAHFRPSDNYVRTDQDTTIRYNEETQQIDVIVNDTNISGELTFSIHPESEKGSELLFILRNYRLDPTIAEDSLSETTGALNGYESYEDSKYRIFEISDALKETYDEQNEALFTCLGIASYGIPAMVPLGTKLDKPNLFFHGSNTFKSNVMANIFKVSNRINDKAKTTVYLYNYHNGLQQDYFAGMENVVRIDEKEILLVTLRNIKKQKLEEIGLNSNRDIFVLDNFDELIEPIEDLPEDDPSRIRTNKAVRAEILSLIQDLTRENTQGRNINFVFSTSQRISRSYNGFLSTCGAKMHNGYIREGESIKLFGKDIRGENMSDSKNMAIANRTYFHLDAKFIDLKYSELPRESKLEYSGWIQGFDPLP